jgi:hypothetical protein
MRRSADKMDFKRLRIHPLLSKPCTESGNEAQNIQSALDDATSQQILFKRKKKGYLDFGDSDRYAIDRDLAKRQTPDQKYCGKPVSRSQVPGASLFTTNHYHPWYFFQMSTSNLSSSAASSPNRVRFNPEPTSPSPKGRARRVSSFYIYIAETDCRFR